MIVRTMRIKGILALVLALVFLAVPFSVRRTAAEGEAVYETTKSFLQYLDEQGVIYTLAGKDSDDDERVDVVYTMDNYDSATVHLYFDSDNEIVSLRIWDIVKVSAGKNYALNVLNKLHNDYKFVKYVFDESDNTVSAQMDMYITPASCGETVFNALAMMLYQMDSDEISQQLKSLE